jgi:hypothetical protein
MKSKSPRSLHRFITIAVVAFSVVAGAAPASAGISVSPCAQEDLGQPFLRWADPLYYKLAPNGGLEQGSTSWLLSGGARIIDQNEPFHVGNATDGHSLVLPPGSSATTAATCVSLLDPSLRLFTVNTGSPLSVLKVEALYTDALGYSRSTTVSLLIGLNTWQPSLPVAFLAQLANPPLLTDGRTSVAFRFTPVGKLGNWKIDDVYVDPFKGR